MIQIAVVDEETQSFGDLVDAPRDGQQLLLTRVITDGVEILIDGNNRLCDDTDRLVRLKEVVTINQSINPNLLRKRTSCESRNVRMSG